MVEPYVFHVIEKQTHMRARDLKERNMKKERNKIIDKLNADSVASAGEIAKYSASYFRFHGKRGGKIGGKKSWERLTPTEQRAQIERLRLAKLSTALKSKALTSEPPPDKIEE